MTRYFIEPRTRKYVKEREFLSFVRNLSNKYGNKLLDTATKTGLDILETVATKLVVKIAEATSGSTGNKIIDKIMKPKPMSDISSRNVEEVVIPPEQRKIILNESRQALKDEILQNISIIKLFNYIKPYDKKMDRSKCFIRWLIFC